MTEEFSDWLQRQLDRKGWSQAEFSRRANVDTGSISRWLAGTTRPDTRRCRLIAEALGVPLDEVYALAGHPSGYEPPARIEADPVALMREAIAIVEEGAVRIPIHDQTASAGEGDDVREYAYVSRAEAAGRNIIALRVHGNSMEPVIDDGDIVVMDAERQPHPGQIVVASSGDTVVVKWLRQEGQRRFLEGNNGLLDAARWKIDGVVFKIEKDAPRGSSSPQTKSGRMLAE